MPDNKQKTKVYKDKKEFDKANKAYTDSLGLYNQYLEILKNRTYKNISTSVIVDSLQKIVDSKPYYRFDETSYKKDLKEGVDKVKNWESYIYDDNIFSSYDRSKKDKETSERIYKNEIEPKFKEQEPIELENGIIRKYDDAFEGIVDKKNYMDTYPDGSYRSYYNGKLNYIGNPNIRFIVPFYLRSFLI